MEPQFTLGLRIPNANEILMQSHQGGAKNGGTGKIGDFRPVSRQISETAQGRYIG